MSSHHMEIKRNVMNAEIFKQSLFMEIPKYYVSANKFNPTYFLPGSKFDI